MFILKKGHQPGVYVPLRALFLVFYIFGDLDLRRYAANDKIFKLFFLHPFLASTIYNNTIKNKFDIG